MDVLCHQAAVAAEISWVKGRHIHTLSHQIMLLPEATAHHSLPPGSTGNQRSLATRGKTGSEVVEPDTGEKNHNLLANGQGQDIYKSLAF